MTASALPLPRRRTPPEPVEAWANPNAEARWACFADLTTGALTYGCRRVLRAPNPDNEV